MYCKFKNNKKIFLLFFLIIKMIYIKIYLRLKIIEIFKKSFIILQN